MFHSSFCLVQACFRILNATLVAAVVGSTLSRSSSVLISSPMSFSTFLASRFLESISYFLQCITHGHESFPEFA